MGGLSALIFPRDSEYPVASVTGYFNRDGQTLPNARLIATAPDLLAAAVRAEAFIAGFDDDNTQDDVAGMLRDLRAAIAKATGRAA